MRTAFVALLLAGLCAWGGSSQPDPPAAGAPPATSMPVVPLTRQPADAPTSATGPAGRAATSPADARAARRAAARLNQRGYELAQAGKWDQCRDVLVQALQADPAFGATWYNLACAYARLGQPARALEHLTRAVELDYSDFRHMQRDEDLAPLRSLPGYRDLLARNGEIQRARAARIRDALDRQFGPDYICEIDHDNKLVFATNVDRQTLEELRTRLTAHAEGLWKDLLANRFEQYVTVVIPSAASPARTVPVGGGGFYNHPDRMLVARQVGMVLTHEFTHALHAADQDARGQRHPIWIMEGLATLYETSEVRDGHVVPGDNLRLNLLKTIVGRRQYVPLRDLLRGDQEQFMRRAGATYPEARYVLMYLYEKGLLKAWYDAYVTGYDSDPTGAAALEKVLGGTLDRIESDWLAWVAQKRPLPVALPADHAYLGVRVGGETDGLRILQVVPGSGAERAGLRPGDVLTHLDDKRVVDPGELVQVVDKCRVGDRLNVRFRREGKYETVEVVLGAMPAELAALPATRPGPTSRPGATTRPGADTQTAPASRPATRTRRGPRRPASAPAAQPGSRPARGRRAAPAPPLSLAA